MDLGYWMEENGFTLGMIALVILIFNLAYMFPSVTIFNRLKFDYTSWIHYGAILATVGIIVAMRWGKE